MVDENNLSDIVKQVSWLFFDKKKLISGQNLIKTWKRDNKVTTWHSEDYKGGVINP